MTLKHKLAILNLCCDGADCGDCIVKKHLGLCPDRRSRLFNDISDNMWMRMLQEAIKNGQFKRNYMNPFGDELIIEALVTLLSAKIH
jgi:hypothetical protein